MRVEGLGLRVWGLGLRVSGLGFRDQQPVPLDARLFFVALGFKAKLVHAVLHSTQHRPSEITSPKLAELLFRGILGPRDLSRNWNSPNTTYIYIYIYIYINYVSPYI